MIYPAKQKFILQKVNAVALVAEIQEILSPPYGEALRNITINPPGQQHLLFRIGF